MRRDNGLSPEFFLCDATLLLARPGAVAVLEAGRTAPIHIRPRSAPVKLDAPPPSRSAPHKLDLQPQYGIRPTIAHRPNPHSPQSTFAPDPPQLNWTHRPLPDPPTHSGSNERRQLVKWRHLPDYQRCCYCKRNFYAIVVLMPLGATFRSLWSASRQVCWPPYSGRRLTEASSILI